jgi:hypothetical protein
MDEHILENHNLRERYYVYMNNEEKLCTYILPPLGESDFFSPVILALGLGFPLWEADIP